MITLTNVHKKYPIETGGTVALQDCSLSIDEGDFVAIIGTSGSGKSTLLNLIGCLDQDYTGTIKIDGIDVSRLSDVELSKFRNERIGFVFQEFNLIDHLTVRENIELPAYFSGTKSMPSAAHVHALTEQLGIADKLNQHPLHLSGGQRQRVAIARALVQSPSILLCDEPTGSLDEETGQALLDMFKTFHQNGLTIVMITHDSHVASMAHRLVRIHDGRLIHLEQRS